MDNLLPGIWVSTLEGIKIKVDGEGGPQEDIMVCLKGMKFPVCDLAGIQKRSGEPEINVSLMSIRSAVFSIGEHKVEI